MNSKQKHAGGHTFSFTLLYSAVVFLILVLVLIVTALIMSLMVSSGTFSLTQTTLDKTYVYSFIGWMALASLITGAILSFLLTPLLMRPFDTLISALNSLAEGDFKTRLKLRPAFSKQPALSEFVNGFNSMAAELEGTELLRSDFINNFSHEFKTPIVSIAGFAALLRRGSPTDGEREEYLRIIEEESRRLAAMATNVMDLTRIESRTILTDVTSYNLSEQLRSCVLLLEDKWSGKNIDIDVDLEEYMIEANEELLRQAWVNLLDNAVKFTPENGKISIKAEEFGSRLAVTVFNTGSYIPPEKLEQVFIKFYQADESHATQGNGIGLAIVKNVAQLHGGTVTASSSEEGTGFTVTLPKSR